MGKYSRHTDRKSKLSQNFSYQEETKISVSEMVSKKGEIENKRTGLFKKKGIVRKTRGNLLA